MVKVTSLWGRGCMGGGGGGGGGVESNDSPVYTHGANGHIHYM